MHNHKLWWPVDVACSCCQVITTFTFHSVHDHVMCMGCLRHQGDTAAQLRQRDHDHVQLWQSEVALINEAHADRTAELNAKLTERERAIQVLNHKVSEQRELLKAELQKAPEATVRAWFDSEAITAANAEVQKAYRSRNQG